MNYQLTAEEQADIDRLTAQRKALAVQRIERQNKLSELNFKIRTGGRMPDETYRRICREQQAERVAMAAIDKQLAPINEKLQEYGRRSQFANQARASAKEADATSAGRLHELLRGVDALRAKYREFAKDMTRVSSMRAMASAFADECQDLIASAKRVGGE